MDRIRLMLTIGAVIPAYNAAAYLEEALQSVLSQTRPADRIVVVDDGSSDSTGEIARRFGPRVTTLMTNNMGVSRARNLGLAESGTDLVAFLDADDVWEPEKLERQAALHAENAECAGSYTAFTICNARMEAERVHAAPPRDDLLADLLQIGNVVGTPSTVMVRRKAALAAGGFDAEMSMCADWDLWLRLALEKPLIALDEPLTRYRVHGRQMSRSVVGLERDTVRLLQKAFASELLPAELRRRRRAIWARQWLVIAGSYYSTGARGRAWSCLARAGLTSPLGTLQAVARRLREGRSQDAT